MRLATGVRATAVMKRGLRGYTERVAQSSSAEQTLGGSSSSTSPYWKSRVLRRLALGEDSHGSSRGGSEE